MSVVRKIRNISSSIIPVVVSKSTTLYLSPGNVLENINVDNLADIISFIRVEADVSDVMEHVSGGKQYLRD